MNSLSRIIITGGAGFIGSHLVPALLARGNEILVIDNLYSGRREYIPAGAGFIDLDLARADESVVFEVFRSFCPDAVIHLAALHYIPHCVANPAETFLANVRSTDVIVRALHGIPAQKLIATSSADVYPPVDRTHVESEIPAPNNPYGLSKFLLEEILAGASRTNPSLSCVVLRVFNVYGPRDTTPHVIPTIVELLRSVSPEIRVGATHTTRDFIHVVPNRTTLLRDTGKYDVFNVGTGQPTLDRAGLAHFAASCRRSPRGSAR